MARSSIAIIGLGGTGGNMTGCLREAGRHEIIVCARRPIPRITFEHDGTSSDFALHTLVSPTEAKPVDWVFVCTKAHETNGAASWLKSLCGAGTRVAVLQNGIDHETRVAPLTGGAPVLPVMVYYNSERFPGDRVRLRHGAEHDIAVPNTPDGLAFKALLDGTNLSVLVSDDFTTLIWRKLLLNAVANPVTALTRLRMGVFQRADIQTLCRDILEEAVIAGRAEGAQFAPDEVERTMQTLMRYPRDAGTSMYFDVMDSKPLEIEALTGAIVAAGERRGRPTPVNAALLAMLKAVHDAATAK